MPNYGTVEDAAGIPPVSAEQKFHMAALYAFDPYVYPFVGVIAGVGRGEGEHGYAERYGLAFADNTVSSFLTVARPSVFLYRIRASSWARAECGAAPPHRHLIGRARSDAGKTMFNVWKSAATCSRWCRQHGYPSSDRSVANTRWGMQVMWDTRRTN
jgi:hypothetical protein